jgi:hypothetical protein
MTKSIQAIATRVLSLFVVSTLPMVASGEEQDHSEHDGYTPTLDWISSPSYTVNWIPESGWEIIRNEIAYNACNDDTAPATWTTINTPQKRKSVNVGGNVSAKAKTGVLNALIVQGEVGVGVDVGFTWESEPIVYQTSAGPITLDPCEARRYVYKMKQKEARAVAGTVKSADVFWVCSGSIVNQVFQAHSPIPEGWVNKQEDGSGHAKGLIETAGGIEAATLEEAGATCRKCKS